MQGKRTKGGGESRKDDEYEEAPAPAHPIPTGACIFSGTALGRRPCTVSVSSFAAARADMSTASRIVRMRTIPPTWYPHPRPATPHASRRLDSAVRIDLPRPHLDRRAARLASQAPKHHRRARRPHHAAEASLSIAVREPGVLTVQRRGITRAQDKYVGSWYREVWVVPHIMPSPPPSTSTGMRMRTKIAQRTGHQELDPSLYRYPSTPRTSTTIYIVTSSSSSSFRYITPIRTLAVRSTTALHTAVRVRLSILAGISPSASSRREAPSPAPASQAHREARIGTASVSASPTTTTACWRPRRFRHEADRRNKIHAYPLASFED
ncbi:hypothetical protein B0H19DRAFT_1266836 [Mycena capillaripes]|nr:hypothetical protein B0H19DRAFT_1266836 [Mycena capillaripes]